MQWIRGKSGATCSKRRCEVRKIGDTWHFTDGSTLTEKQADELADYLETDDVFTHFTEVATTSANPTPSAQ